MGKIIVFSKPDCSHCARAKSLLDELKFPYSEIDVDDVSNRMLMSHVSQQHTVPQIFFNDHHIGGAAELEAIDRNKLESMGKAALDEKDDPEFLAKPPSTEELEKGVMPLRIALEPAVPSDWMELPEHKAIEAWYTEVFGFLVDGYKYISIRPDNAANWMTAFSSIMAVVSSTLDRQWGLACFSTAYTSGCAYCSAHGAGFAMIYGQQNPGFLADAIRYLNGQGELDDLPFSEEQKAFINLAAKTTNHLVVEDDIHRLRKAVGIKKLGAYTASVAAMGGMMGMLTRQVDLLGLEIEAQIKFAIDGSPLGEVWKWGTHDTQEQGNLHNRKELDMAADLPSKLAGLRDQIWELNADKRARYDVLPDALLPNWIGSLPSDHLIAGTSQLYHSSFNDDDLPGTLKHLAAYLVTHASGYPNLAAEERRLATETAEDKELAQKRLTQLEAFAKSRDTTDLTDFDEIGVLVIRFAECSINFPNVVPGRLVEELSRSLKATQISELITCVSVIGLAQRWTGIWEVYNDYMLKQG